MSQRTKRQGGGNRSSCTRQAAEHVPVPALQRASCEFSTLTQTLGRRVRRDRTLTRQTNSVSPCSSPGAFRFAHQLTRKPSDFGFVTFRRPGGASWREHRALWCVALGLGLLCRHAHSDALAAHVLSLRVASSAPSARARAACSSRTRTIARALRSSVQWCVPRGHLCCESRHLGGGLQCEQVPRNSSQRAV